MVEHGNIDERLSDNFDADPINVAYRDALLDRYNDNSYPEDRDNDDDTDDEYYNHFKQSIYNGDMNTDEFNEYNDMDYYDDHDYTNTADKSFIASELNDDKNELNDYPEDEGGTDSLIDDISDITSQFEDYSDINSDDDYDYREEHYLRHPKFQWFRFFTIILFLSIILPIFPFLYRYTNKVGSFIILNSAKSKPSTLQSSGSFATIQKQINQLYNEMSTKEERQKIDFDSKLKIIISQFEKNIKKLLPKKLLNFEDEINRLNIKMQDLTKKYEQQTKKCSHNNINQDTFKKLEKNLTEKLSSILPEKIPIKINNSSSFISIPQINKDLTKIVSIIFEELITNDIMVLSNNNNNPEVDIEAYINTFLNEKLGDIDKTHLINELNRNIEENNIQLWRHIKDYLKERETTLPKETRLMPEQASTDLLKSLITEIYDSDQHQWENDLDFTAYTQGSRLIKQLTSSTYKNGNGLKPIQLLADSVDGSSSSYWQCSFSQKEPCRFAITFNEPMYLSRLFYLHDRLTNNLHIMTSAPRDISIYVSLTNIRDLEAFAKEARKHGQGESHPKNNLFIKIGTYRYDLGNTKRRQQFYLPQWYVMCRPVVKAVLFEIDNNYGNEHYVSLKKFIINGVLKEDFEIIKRGSFPLNYQEGQYISEHFSDYPTEPIKHHTRTHLQQEENTVHRNIPSFGEDEKVD